MCLPADDVAGPVDTVCAVDPHQAICRNTQHTMSTLEIQCNGFVKTCYNTFPENKQLSF